MDVERNEQGLLLRCALCGWVMQNMRDVIDHPCCPDYDDEGGE